MEFLWADEYPALKQICTRFNLTELLKPKRFKYKELPQLLQDGPQCGLVALAICLEKPTKDFVNALYVDADNKNFTLLGEMFSAYNMCLLAKDYLNNRVELFSGDLNTEKIINFLFEGGLMLVPYPLLKKLTQNIKL